MSDERRGMYFDRQGRELTMLESAALLEGEPSAREATRRVALTDVGEVRVSTVWMGLNHAWEEGAPPLIFESMVFGGPLDLEVAGRYSTEAQAAAGHDELVQLVRLEAALDA